MKIDSQRNLVAELSSEKESTQSPVLSTPDQPGYLGMAWRRLRRDRTAMFGGALVILIVLVAILAPVLSPHDPTEQFRDGLTLDGQPVPSTLLRESDLNFTLGTDANGRDLLSRILYGARISLLVGVLANLLAVTIGTFVGSIAAYFGGWLETIDEIRVTWLLP